MKNGKRIESITAETFVDTCPDTSYLGEYRDRAKGSYSIDRKHSLACPVNNPQDSQPIAEKLQRVLSRLWEHGRHIGNDSSNPYYWGLSDAQDIVSEAQAAVRVCNCDENGDWSHRELQYFNTSGNYDGEALADIVSYTKQDYSRMEAYNSGDWCFIGIRAVAEIVIDEHTQRITSSGLWGIESDSGEDYIASVKQDELADLKGQLRALGFSTRAISAAYKHVRHRSE